MSERKLFEAQVVDGGILVLGLTGTLDATTTSDFDDQVQKQLDAGHKKVIVDCRSLVYISSLGIASLTSLQSKLRRQGGVVKIAAVQGPVAQVFRAVRLDKIFEIHADTEQARQSFSPAIPRPDPPS